VTIDFAGRVAIVTGAGNGLGRAHALGLARRGARVVVNDLGAARDGSAGSSAAAEAVVAEIAGLGGTAVADGADVSDEAAAAAMVERALALWGRVDILVNNAGILRDRTFAKMELADFRKVVDVHLMGSVHCTKAVWEPMRARQYGRIVFTTSSSGLYGNFGQANYGAAKTSLVGLMNVLHLEGEKYGIRVNCLAPSAATRMTEELLAPDQRAALAPEAITPGLLYLVGEAAPSRMILAAGAGVFARTVITESEGIYLPEAERTPEAIAAAFAAGADRTAFHDIAGAFPQTARFLEKAAREERSRG
jgi:NAD(P)-dependent dehydrogenase (short-subunit alcohol dehydrogenase family)